MRRIKSDEQQELADLVHDAALFVEVLCDGGANDTVVLIELEVDELAKAAGVVVLRAKW